MTPRRLRFGLLAVASTGVIAAGCLSEYHPEYHPETSYRYEQHVTYPTTVVQAVLPSPPAPSGHVAPVALSVARVTTPGPSSQAKPPSSAASSPEEVRTATGGSASHRPAGTELDTQLSAACLANDGDACRRLAALHVGHRRRGLATAAATGNAFDTTVRGFAWRPVVASVAGSNGGAPGTGPRVALSE